MMAQGFLDRLLASLAPRWAMKRMLARNQIELMTRSWEGGAINRQSARPTHRKEGPRAQTKRNLETTRAQARELYRYNPIARGVTNTIVANLIGCGIKPQARVYRPKKWDLDEQFNTAAEEAWNRWQEKADVTGKECFYSQQNMLTREQMVGGEGLLVLRDGEGEVPLRTELIESERLALTDELDRKNGTSCVQGVELSAAGEITGYWIYPNHPLDGTYRKKTQATLIPAAQVLHYYAPLEPGQTRGLTKFLTVAGAFDGFMQWLDWLLTKERVASAFAAVILQNTALSINSPLVPGTPLQDGRGNDLDYLEGGIVAHLNPGESIQGVSSGVQASSVDLLSQIFLRVIARGLDVSYELVSRDLSKVTYLSARQGENQDRRHWEPQQEHFNRLINYPIWKEFIRRGVMSGALPTRRGLDQYYGVEFIRPGWDWIDPVKEVTADVEAIRAGLRSPFEVIGRRGKDPWTTLEELAQFKEWSESRGLKLSLFEQPKTAAQGPTLAAGDDEDKGQANVANG